MKLEEMKAIAAARTKHQRKLDDIEYHLRMGDCGDEASEILAEFITTAANNFDKLLAVVEAAKNMMLSTDECGDCPVAIRFAMYAAINDLEKSTNP